MKANGKLYLFTIVLISIISMSAYSSDYFFYNGHDRIDLQIDSNYLVIDFDPGSDIDWADIAEFESALDLTDPPLMISSTTYRVHLTNRYDLDQVIENLDQVQDITDISFAFLIGIDDYLYLNNLLVALFTTDLSPYVLDSIMTVNDLKVRDYSERRPYLYTFCSDTKSKIELMQIANTIYLSEFCDKASIDYYQDYQLFMSPNDHYYENQYYCKDSYSDFEEAWDYTLKDTTILIAFLDSGIEPHEDLPSSLIKGGYNYVAGNSDYGFPDSCADSTTERLYHGLASCGITAATINDSLDISGITNNVQIMMQKIFDCPSSASGWGWGDAFIDAVDSGASIICNGWGKESDLDSCKTGNWTVEYGINYADSCGALVIFAAGNCETYSNCGNCVAWPARLENAFAVAASTVNKSRWSQSMYDTGDYDIDVAAAGWAITSLDQMGQDTGYHFVEKSIPCTGDYDVICDLEGTSYAAPQVAGLAALIMARRPDLIGQPDSVKHIIRYSTGNGWNDPPAESSHTQSYELGYGLINAARAMLAVSRGDVDNNNVVNLLDFGYLLSYLYQSGPAPSPNVRLGDANCDGNVNVLDLAYITDYLYNNGSPPVLCFKY